MLSGRYVWLTDNRNMVIEWFARCLLPTPFFLSCSHVFVFKGFPNSNIETDKQHDVRILEIETVNMGVRMCHHLRNKPIGSCKKTPLNSNSKLVKQTSACQYELSKTVWTKTVQPKKCMSLTSKQKCKCRWCTPDLICLT